MGWLLKVGVARDVARLHSRTAPPRNHDSAQTDPAKRPTDWLGGAQPL